MEDIIVSMTTWPPRADDAVKAMQAIICQKHTEQVRFVLVLSKDEFSEDANIVGIMQGMGIEIIWDEGNIKSHKKLIPTIEHYPDSTIITIDDDLTMMDGWLQAIIDEHRRHPSDIIFTKSSSQIVIENGRILEGNAQRGFHTHPGQIARNEKPGSAGMCYPAGTFQDKRFFDRGLFMHLCPTCDETWQWAFGIMAGKTYRCLSSHNAFFPIGSGDNALFLRNITLCTQYHNAIAEAFPEYKIELHKRINQEL